MVGVNEVSHLSEAVAFASLLFCSGFFPATFSFLHKKIYQSDRQNVLRNFHCTLPFIFHKLNGTVFRQKLKITNICKILIKAVNHIPALVELFFKSVTNFGYEKIGAQKIKNIFFFQDKFYSLQTYAHYFTVLIYLAT